MSIFNNNITTLNMESDYIRLMSVKHGKVETYREKDLAEGYIHQGVISKPEEVAGMLSDLIKEMKISRRSVIASMNCFRTVARFITLPKLGGKKLKEAVRWAAEREMPVPLETVNIWWKVIEKTDNEQKVLVLGIPRNALASLYSTLYYAGITPRAVDIKAIALSRTVREDKAVIADMEKGTISVIVKSGGIPVMMRSNIISQANIEIEDRISRLSDELFRTIEFYNAANETDIIETDAPVYLTGGNLIEGIEDRVKETAERNVKILDSVIEAPEGFQTGKYAVNIGLFLREVKSRRSILHADISRAIRFRTSS